MISEEEDFDAFFETATSIFSAISYTLNAKRDEAYFHTLFYLMVSATSQAIPPTTDSARLGIVTHIPEAPPSEHLR